MEKKYAGVSFDTDSLEKIELLARLDRRDRSSMICILIQQEYARRIASAPLAATGQADPEPQAA